MRCSAHGIFNPVTATRSLRVHETVDVGGSLTVKGETTLQSNVLVDDSNLTVSGTVDCERLFVDGSFLVPPGTVVTYIASTAPAGWLLCDGSLHPRDVYPILATVLGSTYGGDSTSFRVPDLRGRTVVGEGTGSSLTARTLGQSGGAETHALSVNEMPSHTHTGTTDSSGAHTHTHNANGGNDGTGLVQDTNSGTTGSTDNQASEFNLTQNPIGLSINSAGAHAHTFTTASAGSGLAHNNMPPFLVLNFIIKI